MKYRIIASLLTGAGMAAILPQATQAQTAPAQADRPANQIQDIVVTARRVSENLQTTPVSITALSGDTLEQRRIVSLEQISELAPNVSIKPSYGFIGAINPFIRGIGHHEVQMGQDSPIGIYIDGVYNGRTNNAHFDLLELERIEVLRGPQGTLFGRNTTGGAISIVTRDPTDTAGGQVKASYGNYDSLAARARIDTGLLGGSGLKATIAVQHRQNDGYVDNAFARSSADYGAMKSDSIWAKIVGEWGDFKLTVSGDYSRLKGRIMYQQGVVANAAMTAIFNRSPTDGGNIYTVSPGYRSYVDDATPPPETSQKTRGVNITAEYGLADGFSLKSIAAWRGYKERGGQFTGANGLNGTFFSTGAGGIVTHIPGISVITGKSAEQSQFSQELQLLGEVGDLSFVLGGFYFQERGDDSYTIFTLLPTSPVPTYFAAPTDYSISNKSYAGFGQVTWKPSFADGNLELTGGIRYSKDKKTMDLRNRARFGRTEPDNTSYLASISYRWTPDIMTYARYATGYRAGGFNSRSLTDSTFVYRPETTKSYEAGFKADLLDRHVRLNGAIYQMDSKGLQVNQYSAVDAAQLNTNARYRGFELEATVVPAEGLTWTGSIGHVDPEFTSLLLPVPGPGLTDYSDIGQFNYVPHWTGNASVNFRLPPASYGTWNFLLSYAYTSRVHFFPTDLPQLNPFADEVAAKAYGVVNGRISLSDVKLGGTTAEIALFGNNILDEHYRVGGVDFGASVGYGTVVWGLPRTYGIELKADF